MESTGRSCMDGISFLPFNFLIYHTLLEKRTKRLNPIFQFGKNLTCRAEFPTGIRH